MLPILPSSQTCEFRKVNRNIKVKFKLLCYSIIIIFFLQRNILNTRIYVDHVQTIIYKKLLNAFM